MVVFIRFYEARVGSEERQEEQLMILRYIKVELD